MASEIEVRGNSPTVRKGSIVLAKRMEPSLTVGLLPRLVA